MQWHDRLAAVTISVLNQASLALISWICHTSVLCLHFSTQSIFKYQLVCQVAKNHINFVCWPSSIRLVHDYITCWQFTPKPWLQNVSQTPDNFMLFSFGYSFHLCSFGNLFMIKLIYNLLFQTKVWWFFALLWWPVSCIRAIIWCSTEHK